MVNTICILILLLVFCPAANAGEYLDSAHGNSSFGVARTDSKLATYSRGNCSHCHEPHMSIEGGEPAPASGTPSAYTLFSPNHVNQTDNFCFKCHTDTNSVQTGGLINRSYSYRAGDWSADTVNDIQEAFSLTSSHSLDDISTFITGKWGYTANSNPCAACHNPHAVQGDPANAMSAAKSNSSRGYPVSRPSAHAALDTWGLWGDDYTGPGAGNGERMNNYAASQTYQAPYRFGPTTTNYEPDGSTTTSDGSNLTDFVTFCTDCHNATDTIVSTALARNVRNFDWSLEKHGQGAASNDTGTDFKAPYQETSAGQYVLSCTDCHEPHGSPNSMLTRRAVNRLNVTIPGGRGNWKSLCDTCHFGIPDKHHLINPGDCTWQCHWQVWVDPPGVFNTEYRDCTVCHYHGSTQIYNGTTTLYESYNGGEHLF